MSSRKDLERICDALVLEFKSMTVTELHVRLTPAMIQRFRERAMVALQAASELRIPPDPPGPWSDEDTYPGRRSAFPKPSKPG